MRNESLKTKITIKKSLNEVLQNDDLIYDRMLDMDQEQLVSMILSFAKNNPSVTLVDYLNNKFGYIDENKTAMNESLEILRMKKLAGLLTEGEYAKALLKEGDFITFNNVMAILNQLLEMGDEGERVLAILERIPEWNELVRDNQDIDM